MKSKRWEHHDRILNWAWALMMKVCPPSHCPPKPTNPTRLLQVMAAARLLGYKLLPHQICMSATSTELASPDGFGGPSRYTETLIEMGRQSGKSATLDVMCAERLLLRPKHRLLRAAQRIESAIEQIDQELWPRLETNQLALDHRIKFRKTPGAPSLSCEENGSWLAIRSTRAHDALRGQHFDGLFVDEVYTLEDWKCDESLRPTLATRAKFGASSFLASTAPREDSLYLAAKRATHKEKANNPNSKLAYWSWAAPDDCDISSPEVWHRSIPGLAFGLIPESFIREEYENTPADVFKRNYLTIPAPTSALQVFVQTQIWKKVELPKHAKQRTLKPAWFGIDADPELNQASIVAADQTGVFELVAQQGGINWVTPFIEGLWDQGLIMGVALISPGPLSGEVQRLTATAQRHKIREGGKFITPLVMLNGREFANASQQLLGGVLDQSVSCVDSGGVFMSAVADSRRRTTPTGSFTIARRDPTCDSSALIAAAIALHAAKTQLYKEDTLVAQSENSLSAFQADAEMMDEELDDW